MMDKSDYRNIEIPGELAAVVSSAISEGKRSRKRSRARLLFKKAGTAAAVLAVSFIALLNLSPAAAHAAYQIPVIGELCRVVTFRTYHFSDAVNYIDVKIPQIENTKKSALEKRVNLEIRKRISDCIAENKAAAKGYYEAFLETGGEPEAFIPVGITVDYEIKCISERYASFVISQYETAFHAYNHEIYYNLDLESGRNLTLKDWYGKDYQKIVAERIEAAIAAWPDERKEMLWDEHSMIDLISEETDFYINQDQQVVVVFPRYEAAYGAAGTLAFTIE